MSLFMIWGKCLTSHCLRLCIPWTRGFPANVLSFGFTLAVLCLRLVVTQTMSRHNHRTQKTSGPRVDFAPLKYQINKWLLGNNFVKYTILVDQTESILTLVVSFY